MGINCIYPNTACEYESEMGTCTRTKSCFYSEQVSVVSESVSETIKDDSKINNALELAYEYLRTHSKGSLNIQSVQDFISWLQQTPKKIQGRYNL